MKKTILILSLMLNINSAMNAQPVIFQNLISPDSIHPAGIAIPVSVDVKNDTTIVITSIDFYYEVDSTQGPGGSVLYGPFNWAGILNPSQTTAVTLPTFISHVGEYSICIYTTFANSDTLCSNPVGSPVLIPPFADDFESGNIGWWPTSSSLQGWELGTPNYGSILGAHTGFNAWAVGRDSGLASNIGTTLYTPIFDFSGGPIDSRLSFWQNRDVEPSWDGMHIEYTIDGNTWTVLGNVGSLNSSNWYNNPVLQSNGLPAWDGNSSGWIKSYFDLTTAVPSPANEPYVQFRFIFVSGPSGYDGIAIDDFQISDCNNLNVSLSTTTNVTCNGMANGSITINVTGGTAPYLYLWSNGTTTQTQVGLSAGTYSVTVQDDNGCTASTTATISEPVPLVMDSVVTVPASCGFSDGEAYLYPSGGTPPYTYLWSGSQTTQWITALSAGVYVVTVTDANACSITQPVTINNISATVIIVDSIYNVSCFGNADGAIFISNTGGSPPFSYIWSNGATTSDITNLAAGTYSITVTDANNCTATISATVTEPPALVIIPPPVTTICMGMDVCINLSGGVSPYTYLWSGFQITQCLSSPSSGTYTVTVTDANGCTATASFTVIVEPLPIIILDSIQNPSCPSGTNGAIYTSVSGGAPPLTYLWSNLVTVQDAINLTAGTYTLTVADNNGCSSSSTFVLGCDSVWPGDANRDGTADNNDLLSIGIGYGSIGPVRSGATISWTGQLADDWTQSLAAGANYKHIDCNGDGVINDADTIAIIQNYGLTHPLRLMPPLPSTLLDPYLAFDFSADTVSTNQQIEIPVLFGSAAIPANDVYGLAFTINYDTSLVKADSVNISFSPSWIGTFGTDMIGFGKNMPLNGQLHVGMTRIDHNNVSGFGEIARVTVVTTDNVSGRMMSTIFDTLSFSFSDVTIIDASETPKAFNIENTTVIVQDSTTGIHEDFITDQVNIYPNPARDEFMVYSSQFEVGEIRITDVYGKEMLQSSVPNQKSLIRVDASSFSSGIYLVRIKTDKGIAMKKLSVTR